MEKKLARTTPTYHWGFFVGKRGGGGGVATGLPGLKGKVRIVILDKYRIGGGE